MRSILETTSLLNDYYIGPSRLKTPHSWRAERERERELVMVWEQSKPAAAISALS